MKRRRKPRTPSWVKFEAPKGFAGRYPFKRTRPYIFLGELQNMKGHCVVADYKTGKIYSGFHTDNFIELTIDEI